MPTILLLACLTCTSTTLSADFTDEAASIARALALEKTQLQLRRSKLAAAHRAHATELARGDATIVIANQELELAGLRPSHCVYLIDGIQVFEGPAAGASFRGALIPGVHTIAVELLYERNGGSRAVRWTTARAERPFRASAHELTRLDVSASAGALLGDSVVAIAIKSPSSPRAGRR